MDRIKSKTFLFVLLLITLSLLCLCGCDNSSATTQLSTPAFINIVDEQDDSGNLRKYLVTDNNINASYYVFGICPDEKYKDDITKYVRKDSEFCYFDVTNIFNNAKTYYFYVQAIGTENYTSSAILFGEPFDNNITLSTTNITYNLAKSDSGEITSCILTWNKVKNASSYDIYINNSKVLNVSSAFNYTDLLQINNGGYFNKNEEINVKVKAVAPSTNNFIHDSNFSNTIKITEHMHESTPTISLNGTTLSWQADKYADYFEIVVSSGLEVASKTVLVEAQTTNVNLTSVYDLNTSSTINCFELLGNYSIKARAIGKITSSEFSNVVNYTKTEKLQSPQIESSYYNQTTDKLYVKINLPTVLDEDGITQIVDTKIIKINIKVVDNQRHYFEETISVQDKTINLELPKALLEEKGLSILNLANGQVSCYSIGYQFYENSNIEQKTITLS